MEQETAQQSFLEAFDAYGDAIFRFCVVKTSSATLAEDLTQETFMRYWQSLRDGKEMTNVRSFLYTIANNLVIDWYRKKKAESLETKLDAGFQIADGGASPEMAAMYTEALAGIEDLEPGDAEVLTLRYVDGFEPRDIAAILGESANTISVRLNRAMKRLQHTLNV